MPQTRTIDTSELIKLVAQMRQAQRDYFKRKTLTELQRAKELERRVDAALAELKTQSPALF